MRSRAEFLIDVRHQVYGMLLALGMASLFGLLFSDLRMTMSAGAVAATGDRSTQLAPLTQGVSMDGFGAWSPDGKRIAFMRDGQILLTDPSGKRVRPLTSQPEHWDAAPAWRPDGKAIAFVRTAMQGEKSQIMLVEPDGKGAPVSLVSEPAQIGYLAWSPDGEGIYYSTKQEIVRAPATGGKRTVLFHLPGAWEALSGGLAVSPDGRQLLFGAGPRTERGVQYEIWRMPAEGGKPVQVTRQGGIMPGYHPTGQRIAFRNPRQGTGIYLIDLARAEQRQIVPDEPKAMYFHPAFSPDGRQLLLSRLLLEPAPTRGHGFTSHLYLHTLQGSGGD